MWSKKGLNSGPLKSIKNRFIRGERELHNLLSCESPRQLTPLLWISRSRKFREGRTRVYISSPLLWISPSYLPLTPPVYEEEKRGEPPHIILVLHPCVISPTQNQNSGSGNNSLSWTVSNKECAPRLKSAPLRAYAFGLKLKHNSKMLIWSKNVNSTKHENDQNGEMLNAENMKKVKIKLRFAIKNVGSIFRP